jgi:VIT1/CCC1 family predicted Fe2+/Mn2+ transporter
MMSPRRDEVQVRRFRELLASEQRSAAQYNRLAEATSGAQRKVLAELAVTSMKDRDAALDTMAREELGLDPDQFGSQWSAAVSSLLSFALGAVVVVLPFVFGSGLAVPIAIASAGMALIMVGAKLNGRNVVRCGARQLFVGVGADLLVYMIGHVVGVRGGA